MSKIHLIAQLQDFYPVFYYLYNLKNPVEMNALGIFLVIGPWQIAVIVVIVLLLFGGKKIPELMRGLGSGIKEFKDASREDDKLEEKKE
jgi:sec-independent protein translocase protein TatA